VQSSLQGASATISVPLLTNLAGLGDDEVGYSVTLTVPTPGQPQTLYDDIVAVRVGRAILSFNFQNLGGELPMGRRSSVRPRAGLRRSPLDRRAW
jgi:hypothetical protein